jgi:hypothetical protein
MQLCLHVVFPFRKKFNQKVFLDLVDKILPISANFVYATASFDFGCPKGTHIVFALVVIFLNED